jgi:hypothetical protein
MKVQVLIFSLVITAVYGLRFAQDPVSYTKFDPWEEFSPQNEVHQFMKEPSDDNEITAYVNKNIYKVKTLAQNEIESHFPNRHNMTNLRTRLEAILSTDPNHADMLVSGFGWPGGFGSRVLMFFNEVALALYFQKSVAFCNSTFLKKVYLNFYEAPKRMSIFNDPSRPPQDRWDVDLSGSCRDSFMVLGRDSFAPALMAQDFEFISSMKRVLYQSLMILKPSAEKKITNRLDAIGVQEHTQYIGVHIRHGDKSIEMDNGLVSTEQYAHAIQKELDATGLTSVYVASDDPDAADRLKDMLGSKVTIWQQYTKSSESRSYDDEGAVLDFLTDVEALRRARVFIGTQSSNTGRLIYYGRSDGEKSISLDGEWHKCPKVSSDAMCA